MTSDTNGADLSRPTINLLKATFDVIERDVKLGLVEEADLRFTIQARKKVARELADQGMSTREIAKVTGTSKSAVHRDLSQDGTKTAPKGDKPVTEIDRPVMDQTPWAAHGLPPPHDDDDEPDNVETDVEPENYRSAFFIRADQARKFAVYSGPVDDEIALMARQVAAAWQELATKLNGG